MRLIDADDLIITILTHDLCDTEQIDKDILEAPTVEAIPVEWIKAWGTQFCDDKGHYNGDGYDSIWDMLEAWEQIENTPSICPGCIKK